MTKYFCLIKFGQKEHLEDLMNLGRIRFGAIDSFRKSSEPERGDKYEGMLQITNGELSKVECNHPTLGIMSFKPIPNSLSSMMHFSTNYYYSFSSYAISEKCFENSDNHIINSNMINFGAYALIIKEPILFFKAVNDKLNELNLNSAFGLVNYQDFTQEGEYHTTLFTKTIDLSHQFEHRVLIKSKNEQDSIFIEVGSLAHFCCVVKSEYLFQTTITAKRS